MHAENSRLARDLVGLVQTVRSMSNVHHAILGINSCCPFIFKFKICAFYPVVNLLFLAILQKMLGISSVLLERSAGGILAHDLPIGSKQKNCIFIRVHNTYDK